MINFLVEKFDFILIFDGLSFPRKPPDGKAGGNPSI